MAGKKRLDRKETPKEINKDVVPEKTIDKIAQEKIKALQLTLSQIEKQFGKGSIMTLKEEHRKDVAVIPTGALTLDLATGIGGVPRGRIVEIYGPEGSGKTTLTLNITAQVQKLGGIAAFIDAEHALDPAYAKKIGVKLEDLLISKTRVKLLTIFLEKHLSSQVV